MSCPIERGEQLINAIGARENGPVVAARGQIGGGGGGGGAGPCLNLDGGEFDRLGAFPDEAFAPSRSPASVCG